MFGETKNVNSSLCYTVIDHVSFYPKDSEDTEEKDESQQVKHASPKQQKNKNLDENKDIMEMEKAGEPKPDINVQTPVEPNTNVNKSFEKNLGINQHQGELNSDVDNVRPLQMPKTLERKPVMEVKKEETKVNKTEIRKQAEPVAQKVHHQVKEEEKASRHENVETTKHPKPATKAKVVMNEAVAKSVKKVVKKPLLKYIHRIVSPVTMASK